MDKVTTVHSERQQLKKKEKEIVVLAELCYLVYLFGHQVPGHMTL